MEKTKRKKIVVRAICIFLAVILLIPLSYLLYVVFAYYRVEDSLSLEVVGEQTEKVPIGESLTITTYNIGFGAYSDDYSFFMDGGERARAISKQAVVDNINGAINEIKPLSPHFALFQEVDVKGTRSYDVDQTAMLSQSFTDYNSVFAQNYDSPYFLYPFNEPIGANRSGIMTFSTFGVQSAIRRSLPIEKSLTKYLDLDRAYSVVAVPTSNGRSLVLYNVHLSAYTTDGTIADEQLKILCQDMSEQYNKGNYVIAGGDFNKDLLGDSSKFFTRTEGEYNWAKPLNVSLLPSFIKCYSGENYPTCRNADSPFVGDGTDFVLSVDGFLLSDNVSLLSCQTVNAQFKFSDHNPVTATFSLNDF